MSEKIPEFIRKKVAERALFKCEYCLIREEDMVFPYQIDHIISKKHKGGSEMDNLAFACSMCNQFKGTDIASCLTPNGAVIPLFHPRKQDWEDHFKYLNGEILAKTEVGEATAQLLHFNSSDRIMLRKLLEQVGRYP